MSLQYGNIVMLIKVVSLNSYYIFKAYSNTLWDNEF